MAKPSTKIVPEALINKIGTEQEVNGVKYTITGYFITRKKNKYVVFGFEFNEKPTQADINEWKKAVRIRNNGGFSFTPGMEIGNVEVE